MFALIRHFMSLEEDADSSSSTPAPPTYQDIMTLLAKDGVPFQNPGDCVGSINCLPSKNGKIETG
jgi:hypothetical protein